MGKMKKKEREETERTLMEMGILPKKRKSEENIYSGLELGRGYLVSDQYRAYCYYDAVKQFKEVLESRGIPLDKVKILHTHSAKLPEFFHSYQFVYKIEEKGKGNLERPLCVECSSKHVISRGDYWRCVDCGRWWTKIRRKEKQMGQMEQIKTEVKAMLDERIGKRTSSDSPYLAPNWDDTDIQNVMDKYGVSEKTALKYIKMALH